jgi:hypothetical protein
VSEPVARTSAAREFAGLSDRRVVMVVAAEVEPSLADVVNNLSSVCSEVGQRVALISTDGLASAGAGSELPQTPMWWKQWPPSGSPGNGTPHTAEGEPSSLLRGPLNPTDVENLLGETGIPGVWRLDLRYFVGHPTQVVIRVPEVLTALREIVDVVFLEVPSFLSIHHGEGLTPFADVVLVVAERETTTTNDMRRLSAVLRRLRAPVVGMALTDGGLEIYDWGRVDAELQAGHELAADEREPTQQIPISKPADDAAAPPLDELSVVEHVPRAPE